jgi:hypothetical protein
MALTAASTPPPGGGVSVARLERTLVGEWQAEARREQDAQPTMFSIPVETPPAVPRIDVTVTVTLDYETSDGSPAQIGVTYRENGEVHDMRPGRIGLAPAADGATATLSWTERSLPADGRGYVFEVGVVAPAATGRPEMNLVRGSRATAVVEVSIAAG